MRSQAASHTVLVFVQYLKKMPNISAFVLAASKGRFLRPATLTPAYPKINLLARTTFLRTGIDSRMISSLAQEEDAELTEFSQLNGLLKSN